LLVGAAVNGQFSSPELDKDLVLLGISGCTLPINGQECKEGSIYDELARIPLNIPEGTWQNVSTTFTTSSNYEAIMFGLTCDNSTSKYDKYYALFDDIIITQGQPCTGNEVIKDFPGDVELFKCEGCFGPETINTYINQ